MIRPVALSFLLLASLLTSCVHDRKDARHRRLEPAAPLRVIITQDQCAVLRLSTGYIALFIVKDSPTTYYGGYYSKTGTFGWPRPAADGIVEASGTISIQGVKLRLQSVSEFAVEVALTDSNAAVTGLAVGPWTGVGDVRVDQLTYLTDRR
ncbi:MAG TPA: hypothetical protein VGH19_15300 [Verrucomicrobiae bacterium]